jgi:hypothetical protein
VAAGSDESHHARVIDPSGRFHLEIKQYAYLGGPLSSHAR